MHCQQLSQNSRLPCTEWKQSAAESALGLGIRLGLGDAHRIHAGRCGRDGGGVPGARADGRRAGIVYADRTVLVLVCDDDPVRVLGQRFGAQTICDVLRGKESQWVRSFRLTEQSTFALLKEVNQKRIKSLINELEAQGYIVYVGVGKPILKVTDAGWLVLRGKAQVQAREALTIQTAVKTSPVSESDTELFDALRELRAKIARKRGVPAFVIFSDSALHDMCLKMPTTDEEFLTVNGVGETKLKLYGKLFTDEILAYKNSSLL